MAPFICCGFKRHASPGSGPSPIRLIDNPQARGRFSISTTETLGSSADGAAQGHPIFASDEAQGGSFQAESLTEYDTKQNVQRDRSVKDVHAVTSRIRKSMSRDLGISKQVSTRLLRSSQSHERGQPHQEVKNGPHRKVASGFRASRFDNESEYDEDAVPMRTPRSTWGRDQGASVEDVPQRPSRMLEHSLPPSSTSHSERDRRDVSSEAYATRSAASTLSRMLTDRGRQAEKDHINDKAEGINSTHNPKYTFRDGSESPRNLPTQNLSPLGRSDTIIRTPSSSAVVELGRPIFLNTLGTQSTGDSPNIGPQRIPSIHDSIAGREWRLSYAPGQHPLDHLHFPETIANQDVNDAVTDNQALSISAVPGAWTCGPSELFQGVNYAEQSPCDTNRFVESTSQPIGQGNPASNEGGFGEADDANEGISTEGSHKVQDPYSRKHFSGSDSVHLYNMHIPQRLASQTVLQSVSEPFLQEPATASKQHSFVDGGPPRRDSSSTFYSTKVPTVWDLPRNYATSSLYSQEAAEKYAASSSHSRESPYVTTAESHRSSLMFLNKIADRMSRYGPAAQAKDIISVPGGNSKHVDLNMLERRTRETSYESSNESLYNRELAAAATRFIPRAQTVNIPKSSWFIEDFEDVAAAIASSNPRRRSVSETLNRKPSLSGYDGNKERRLSIRPRADRFDFIAGGNEDAGASVWEKALREHEQQDATLSRTRLGSMGDHHNFVPRHRHHGKSGESPHHHHHHHHHHHIFDRFSPDHKRGELLQAKLGAYEIPRRRTPTDELKPISSPSSHSSWTRYSSHERDQRSSASAGEAENVFARDFAEEAVSAAKMAHQAPDDIDPTASLPATRSFPNDETDEGKQRRSKSMSFGRGALAKLRKVYRMGSLEFASRTAFGSYGHRSSVSEGKTSEYPELEMLPPASPLFYSDLRGGASTSLGSPQGFFDQKGGKSEEVVAHQSSPEPVTSPEMAGLADIVDLGPARDGESASGTGSLGARRWSRMYVDDCVTYPPNSPPLSSDSHLATADDVVLPLFTVDSEGEGAIRGLENEEEEEEEDTGGRQGKEWHRHGSPDGNSEEHTSPTSSDPLRRSTLDFKRSLEWDGWRAREAVLGLGFVGARGCDAADVSSEVVLE